MGQGLADAL